VSTTSYERAKRYYHPFILRIEHEDFAAIKKRAKQQDVTIHELLRRWVEWGMENDDVV
jgi:hypothetical protein